MPDDTSAVPYGEAVDDFQKFQSFLPDEYKQGITPQSFAQMSQKYGGPDYSSLQHGDVNAVRTFAAKAGDWIGNSPVGDVGADVGGSLWNATGGDRAQGEQFGRDTARSAAEFAPALAGPWGLAAGIGASALDTYGKTGSIPQAGLTAAEGVALPGIAHAGESLAAKSLFESGINPTAGNALSFLAGQAGMGAASEGINQLGSLIQGKGFDTSRGPIEILREQAANVVGFAPLMAAHGIERYDPHIPFTKGSYTDLINQREADAAREKNQTDKQNADIKEAAKPFEQDQKNAAYEEQFHEPEEISQQQQEVASKTPLQESQDLAKQQDEKNASYEDQFLHNGQLDESLMGSPVVPVRWENKIGENVAPEGLLGGPARSDELERAAQGMGGEVKSLSPVNPPVDAEVQKATQFDETLKNVTEKATKNSEVAEQISKNPPEDAKEHVDSIKEQNTASANLAQEMEKAILNGTTNLGLDPILITDDVVKTLGEYNAKFRLPDPSEMLKQLLEKAKGNAQDYQDLANSVRGHIIKSQMDLADRMTAKNNAHAREEDFLIQKKGFTAAEQQAIRDVDAASGEKGLRQYGQGENPITVGHFAKQNALKFVKGIKAKARGTEDHLNRLKEKYATDLENGQHAADKTDTRLQRKAGGLKGDEEAEPEREFGSEPEEDKPSMWNPETGEFQHTEEATEPFSHTDSKDIPPMGEMTNVQAITKTLRDSLLDPDKLLTLLKDDDIAKSLRSLKKGFTVSTDKESNKFKALVSALEWTLRGDIIEGEHGEVPIDRQIKIDAFHKLLESFDVDKEKDVSKYRNEAVAKAKELIRIQMKKIPNLPSGLKVRLGKVLEKFGDVISGLQREANLKSWFGKSKVVDEHNNPLRVYHGTTKDFSRFSASKLGKTTGHPTSFLGHFFTTEPRIASEYAGANEREAIPGGNIKPVFLRVENPKILNDDQFENLFKLGTSAETIKEIKEEYLSEGYDGIKITSPDNSIDTWVTFKDDQIKSATGNRGTFDKSSNIGEKLGSDILGKRSYTADKGDFRRSTPSQFIASVGEVARQFARDKGMSEGDSLLFKGMLQSIAARFPKESLENVTLKDLIGDNKGGMGVFLSRPGREGTIVALSREQTLGQFSDTFAHELLHRLKDYADRQYVSPGGRDDIYNAYQKLTDFISGKKQYEQTAIIREMLEKAYSGNEIVKPEDIDRMALYAMKDPNEFLATYTAAYIHSMMSDHPGMATLYKDSPAPLRTWQDKIAEFLHGMWDTLKSTLTILKNFVGEDVTKTEKMVQESMKMIDSHLDKMLSAKGEVRDALEMARNIEARLSTKGLMDNFRENPVEYTTAGVQETAMSILDPSLLINAQAKMKLEDLPKIAPQFLWHFLKPAGVADQFFGRAQNVVMARMPQLMNYSETMHMYEPLARDGAKKDLAHTDFAYKDGRLVKQNAHDTMWNLAGSKLLGGENGLYSKLARWMNDNSEKLGNDAWLDTPDKVSKWALKEHNVTLSSKDADLLATASLHAVQAHRNNAAHIIEAHYQVLGTTAATLLSKAFKGLDHGIFESAGNDLLEAAKAKAAGDIKGAESRLASVVARLKTNLLDPNILRIGTMVDQEVGKIGETSVMMLGKDGKGAGAYTPEQRPGKFIVRYDTTDPKTGESTRGAIGADTKFEAEQKLKALNASGKTNVEIQDKGQFQDFGIQDHQLDILQKYEDRLFNYIKSTLSPEEAETLDRLYSPLMESRRQLAGKGLEGSFMNRRFAPGRETLDMFPIAMNSILAKNRYLARSITSAKLSLAMQDPKLQSDPESLNYAQRWAKQVLYPESSDFHKLNTFTNLFYTAGNFSTLFVEGMQGLQMIPSFLIEGSNGKIGFGESYKHLGSGYEFAMRRLVGQLNPWEKQLLERAQSAGIMESMFNETLGTAMHLNVSNIARVMDLKRPTESIASLAHQGAFWTVKLSEQFHNFSAYVNKAHSLGASVAALKAHPELMGVKKASDLTMDHYISWAKRVNDSTSSATGRAGRAVGLYEFAGKAGGIVSSMNVLQGYATTMLGSFARLGRNAIIKNTEGGASRSASLKALGAMLGSTVALSGIFGVQPLGAIVGVLQTIMGKDCDLSTDMREHLLKMFHEDSGTGSLLTDIAMKGLPSTLMPVDISARLGMGQLFGIDANGAPNLSNAIGATASMADQIYKGVTGGVQQASLDNPQGAIQSLVSAMPTALRRASTAFSDGNVRDSQGRVQGQLDGVDKVLSTLGFQSSKVSSVRDEERAVKASEYAKKDDIERLYNQASAVYQKGDPKGALQLLQQRAQVDPSFDLKSGVNGLVTQILKQTEPINPLRTAPVGSGLSSVYGNSQAIPEVQRVKDRENVLHSLGQPPDKDLVLRFRNAKMVDGVLQQHPEMTRNDALAFLKHQGLKGPLISN